MPTLAFYEPGHFHAALTLRVRNPRVDTRVHLYARPSPDRAAFLSLVHAFNDRAHAPTGWEVTIHEEGDDLLGKLIADRPCDAVVLAGKNDVKLASIARLHAAGIHVLADKPWVTNALALAALHQVTPDSSEATAGALAMDIMTERHDVVARLRKKLVDDNRLFGGFRTARAGGEPAIEIRAVHHLLKIVNRAPLQRPPWYYDIRVQGDGLVDIQSHLTDQAQWLLEGERPFDFDTDVVLVDACAWETPVPRALYAQSTGLAEFDTGVAADLSGDVLGLRCNGQIDYRLRGVAVRQWAEWRQREPEGGGDLHHTVMRGTRSDVVVRQGPETGYRAELHLRAPPGTDPMALRRDLEALVGECRSQFPGLSSAPSDLGLELKIPDAIRSGHETHFAMVLETFLDYLEAGRWPASLNAAIRTRYTLLANAHALAQERST